MNKLAYLLFLPLSAVAQTPEMVERVCFTPQQLQRGVEHVVVGAPNPVEALILTAPLVGDTVDCSSNQYAYPFAADGKEREQGVWFGPEAAARILERDWVPTDARHGKKGDIVVWRENGEIVQVGLVNTIVFKETGGVVWIADINLKGDITPPQRHSFEVPTEVPVLEMWTRK